MKKFTHHRTLFSSAGLLIITAILFSGIILHAGETAWMAVGSLHDWYSSIGSEIEVGRTFLVSDQQDGLRWPATYLNMDCKAAKAMWIGCTNYQDPLIK